MTARSKGEPSKHDAAGLLRIYLEDHLAGAGAGVRRVRRFAEAERDGPDGAMLASLADEIELDRAALCAVIDHLGVAPRSYKRLLARAGEVVGLLKLNGRVFKRSPLTTLVETEVMLLAVRGKLAGWQTLRSLADSNVLGPIDLEDLVERALAQLEMLDAMHSRVAVTALGRLEST